MTAVFLLVGGAVEPAQVALSANHIWTCKALARWRSGARITVILFGPAESSPVATALAIGFTHPGGANVINKRPEPSVFICSNYNFGKVTDLSINETKQ